MVMTHDFTYRDREVSPRNRAALRSAARPLDFRGGSQHGDLMVERWGFFSCHKDFGYFSVMNLCASIIFDLSGSMTPTRPSSCASRIPDPFGMGCRMSHGDRFSKVSELAPATSVQPEQA